MGDVALVAGASGVTGRNFIQHFAQCGSWTKIYASSRRKVDFDSKVDHITLDLGSKDSMLGELAKVGDVTHVFFCAYQYTGNFAEDASVNFELFKNLIDALEKSSKPLKHVFFMSGTKWYGYSIGAFKTPSKEDDPRTIAPCLYYPMEDFCINRKAEGAPWTWSSLRPNPVCGFSTGSAMNLTMTIAVYASICKELSIPMRFPGSAAAYDALLEVVDVAVLADAAQWIALHPEAANTSYNCSNGDVFRWSDVWPKLASFFELAPGEPQKFSMVTVMADYEDTWNRIVKQHSLVPHTYKEIATWEFGDWVFGQEKDWFTSVNKLRRAGYHQMTVDTCDMFVQQFQKLREDKVIP
ncbi:3-oxo-Delta(4,5)-steroid 5-beta-reductase [Coccomyxa sp. Obi]|nr:3-oxo-Delta(4,5)-steroid 5-beta-reductase [Coccomyxa sp. Obi]